MALTATEQRAANQRAANQRAAANRQAANQRAAANRRAANEAAAQSAQAPTTTSPSGAKHLSPGHTGTATATAPKHLAPGHGYTTGSKKVTSAGATHAPTKHPTPHNPITKRTGAPSQNQGKGTSTSTAPGSTVTSGQQLTGTTDETGTGSDMTPVAPVYQGSGSPIDPYAGSQAQAVDTSTPGQTSTTTTAPATTTSSYSTYMKWGLVGGLVIGGWYLYKKNIKGKKAQK